MSLISFTFFLKSNKWYKKDWSDDKKLQIIEKVYKELSDSNHPVSVAVAKMQEIEEVKIIEEKE